MAVSPSAVYFDIPVMIAVAGSCLPLFFAGRKIDRWKGMLFLFYYCAYTVYLVLASQQHASIEIFTKAMIWFTIPITVLTLIAITVREVRKGGGKK
jgi:cation:H+ antiporter